MRHSLRGLCGLKSSKEITIKELYKSQPARAVWIEIVIPQSLFQVHQSQPARAVWIEIKE